VIRARLVGDARIGAEEGGSEFGYELLDRIGLVAETLAELAIAAALVARPVLLSITEASPVSFPVDSGYSRAAGDTADEWQRLRVPSR
jgi:hypothetical protein